MVDVNIDEDLLNRVIDNLEAAGNEVAGEAGRQLRQSLAAANTALEQRVDQAVGLTNTALQARIAQAVSESNTALADRINQVNSHVEARIDQVQTNVVEPTFSRLDTFVDDLKRKLVRGAILVLDLIVLGVLVFFLWALAPISTTQLIIAVIVLGIFFAASIVLLLSDRAINYVLGLGP